MLVNDDELNRRVNNPLNLMNRIREGKSLSRGKQSLSLFTKKVSELTEQSAKENSFQGKPTDKPTLIPSSSAAIDIPATPEPVVSEAIARINDEHPSTDDLIKDANQAIGLAAAHDKAVNIMVQALDQLAVKLPEANVKTIPTILAAAQRTVEGIRKERLEREKNNRGNEEVHYHFYCPEPKKIEQYEVIEVG